MQLEDSISTVDMGEPSNVNGNGATEATEATSLLPKPKSEEETEIDTSFSDSDSDSDDQSTYIGLIMSNRPFRLYLSSYLITHAGEWFTYVATIELIEEILGEKRASSKLYISLLVACRLLPNFLLIPFGGVLADAKDRRHSMIILDLLGAIAPLFYLIAAYWKSIEIVYMVTVLQASISALYEPCRSSIIPLMVTGDEPMKKATTLAGLAWSLMAAVGSSSGGYYVSIIGLNACFIVDSISFLISGFLMYLVGGSWDVSSDKHDHLSFWGHIEDMAIGGFNYIRKSNFWPLVLIKSTICLVFGGGDVINVSFSEEDPDSSEAEQSRRLAALFSMIGIGCILGPLVSDPFLNMTKPKTILYLCAASFGMQAVGNFCMGLFSPFAYTLIGTMLRASGSSIAWIDSQILLQAVVSPDMLGRVLAVDYGLALLSEATAAAIAGLLLDNLSLSPMQVSIIMGILGGSFFVSWLLFAMSKMADVVVKAHATVDKEEECGSSSEQIIDNGTEVEAC